MPYLSGLCAVDEQWILWKLLGLVVVEMERECFNDNYINLKDK